MVIHNSSKNRQTEEKHSLVSRLRQSQGWLFKHLSLIDDQKLELPNNSSLLVDLCPQIGSKKGDLKQKVL